MNYDTTSISMNIDIGKKKYTKKIKKKRSIFFIELYSFYFLFSFLFFFLFWKKKKGGVQEKGGAYKIKDFFVSIVVYLIGGLKYTLDRNLGEYGLIISTNLKPLLVFFLYYV